MPVLWLSILTASVVLLVTVSGADRSVRRLIRTRWPDSDFDGQSLLVWGIVALGTATTLLFLLLAMQLI